MPAPTPIPVIQVPFQGQINVTDNLMAAALDMSFINDGYTILVVVPGAVTPTLTIHSVPSDIPGTVDITGALVASETVIYGPFQPLWWNQAGSILLTFSAATSVQVACFQLQY